MGFCFASKYGDWAENVEFSVGRRVRGKEWLSWWRDLIKFVGRLEWFREGVSRKIGDDGKETGFWLDNWAVGGKKLKECFPRLYSLDSVKDCTINERVLVSDVGVIGNWAWRRSLFEWELDLVKDLELLLNKSHIFHGSSDVWQWRFSPNGEYSSKSGYDRLLMLKNPGLTPHLDKANNAWINGVPFKINAFVWKFSQIESHCCQTC